MNEADAATRKHLRENPIWFQLHWTRTDRLGKWHQVHREETLHLIEGNVGACRCGVHTSWVRGRGLVRVNFTRDEPDGVCGYSRPVRKSAR